MPQNTKSLSVFCGLALFLLSSAGSPTLFARESQVLEEVIVSAERRQQSAQDVAISMTVFNQEEIANAGMTNTADLATLTPSLSTLNRFGPENASFSVRGFTKDLRTTATVGVYFAEVVAPRGQTVQTSGDGAGPGMFFDLQNVQVLKGPQGTLFGRNTTGGAILIVPHKPVDEFEGSLDLMRGNFDTWQVQGVLNIPISEKLKVRLGYDRKQRDGHITNTTGIGGDDLGNANYSAGRLSVLADFTDNLQNYTVINYAESDTHGYNSQIFLCNTSSDPTDAPLRALRPGACERQLEQQQASGNDGFYDGVSTVPDALQALEDLRVINTLTWALNDATSVKAITAYSHLVTETGLDLFGTQFTETQAALIGAGVTTPVADPRREFSVGVSLPNPDFPVTSQEAWVGELQVQGLAFNSRLEWQSGIYYENSKPDGNSGSIQASSIYCELATLVSGDPSTFNCFDQTAGAIGSVRTRELQTEYLSRAVYAHASYDLLQSLSVALGLRYSWDETEGFSRSTVYTFAGPVAQQPRTVESNPVQESEAPTGLLEFQYRPYEDTMFYAKYVRGYRQGGVNLAADPGVDIHDAETVDNYEVGAKMSFSWPLPIRANVSLFDNDFRDMQLQTGYLSPSAGATTAIFNAGRAEIKGWEAQLMVELLPGLTADISYSRLMTELLEQDQAGNEEDVEQAGGPIAGATFTPIAVVGDTLPFAPDKSYTASLSYRLPVPESVGRVRVGATYAYTGVQRMTASGTSPFDELAPYRVLNLNLSWSDMLGKPVDLTLFGTNVQDREYTTYISGTFSSLGFESRMPGIPRLLGARLSYRF